MAGPYPPAPDTRAAGTANPPGDNNANSDAIAIVQAVLAQMAGYPGNSSIPADNTANATALQTIVGTYTGPGLAPSGDDTGATDTANIQNLMNLCSPGKTAQLQAGAFNTNAPLIQPPWVTLEGYGTVLNNSFRSDYPTTIMPVAGFEKGSAAKNAVLLMVSETVGGYDIASAGQQVLNINIDGTNGPASLDGIDVYGSVNGTVMRDVCVQNMTGSGIQYIVGPSSDIPDGVRMEGILSSYNGGFGFFFQTADLVAWDLHSSNNDLDGCRVVSAANSIFHGCRMASNNNRGWNFGADEGAAAPGGFIVLDGCNSQLNIWDGLYVDWPSNGGNTLVLAGFTSLGDGLNDGAGGGGYAGVTVVSSVAPIIFDNLVVIPSAATTSPEYGISVAGASYFSVSSGSVQGYTQAVNYGSGNGSVLLDPSVQFGTGTPGSPTWSPQLLPLFGDGSDGAVVLNGSTTYNSWSSLSGDVYTMTRDVYATSITVDNGVTLKPGAYRIFCQGALVINSGGEIAVNGNNGGNGTGSAGGSAGGSITAETNAGGRAGGAGGTTTGSSASVSGLYALGGSGGNGGAGTDAAGTGATASTVFGEWYKNPIYALMGCMNYQLAVSPIGGGAGGGGGGGNGTAGGGGGGGGGGLLIIFAWIVVNNGTISATGGAGGAAYATGDTGGGGGGGGGCILAYTVVPWTAGTTSVAGGTFGAGGSTGSNGVAGSSGTVANILVA